MATEFTPTDTKIITHAANLLGTSILSCCEIARGDSVAYELTTSTGNFIYRTGSAANNYDVEHALLERLHQRDILVPRSIAADITPFGFSLQAKIPGQPLDQTPKNQRPHILGQIGTQLNLIYQNQLPGFGQIDPDRFRKSGQFTGRYDNLPDFLYDYIYSKLPDIDKTLTSDWQNSFKHSQLSLRQARQIGLILKRAPIVLDQLDSHRSELQEIPGSLVHGDLHLEHFLVENGQLTGLIDFAKTLIADPLFDIAYFSVMPNGLKYYRRLARSANVPIDNDLFHLYRATILIGKIHTRYVKRNYLRQYPEILDYAIEELA